MDNDKVKCSVEVWDMNASGENSFMIGKADIDIKSMFDKSNLYTTMMFRFKASNTGGKHSADVVLSMEASKQ